MMILVTTPTNKIGSALVSLLSGRGIAVRVGAHTVEKAQKLFPNLDVVALDLSNAASVNAALNGVDGLYLAPPARGFSSCPTATRGRWSKSRRWRADRAPVSNGCGRHGS